jgi:hypothetical protein
MNLIDLIIGAARAFIDDISKARLAFRVICVVLFGSTILNSSLQSGFAAKTIVGQ